ncbi:unnamed protein product [Penicillium pancosmium]
MQARAELTRSRKPSLESKEEDTTASLEAEDSEITTEDLPALAAKDELRNLGYMPDQSPLFGKAAPTSFTPATRLNSEAVSSELKNVLRLLPPKPYTDILVQRYLEVTNYSYYALYPPIFSQDYAAWWSDRASGKPLTPEFTCLLIRVCACSSQYLDSEIQSKLESELGESVQSLSESYHHAAKQLSNTIAPGKGGLAQIQQLFLTAAWFKSESFFVESWHSLSSCIHEAQELGMHKKYPKPGLSEFEIEMRRRLWCLLYVWDWQMSMLLSRPLIINPAAFSYELPNMKLETLDPASGPPSPVSHIASQCELGQMITKDLTTMGGTTDVIETDSIKSDIETWIVSLPAAYQEDNPDTRWDEEHIYVPLQRRQLHAIGYMTMLLPFKGYLVKTFDSQASDVDRARRASAIEIALHLMKVSHRLFDHVFPVNAKFHLVTFLIFDTAAFLCSAIIHDKDRSLPQREEVFQAIKLACSLMGQLAPVTKTGAICYPVLDKLARSLSPKTVASVDGTTTGDISNTGTMTFNSSPDFDFLDADNPESLSSSLGLMPANGMFLPTSADLDFLMAGMEIPPIMSIGDFSNLDVGQFDQIWDWQNLDLTLLPPPHTK